MPKSLLDEVDAELSVGRNKRRLLKIKLAITVAFFFFGLIVLAVYIGASLAI